MSCPCPHAPQVTIYRLVSKSTYEANVFAASSRKYGGRARRPAAWVAGTREQSAGFD